MAENPFLWDITASNNDDADPAVPWPEGMLPGSVNNAARAVMAGFARYISDTNGTLTTTGSSNAYAVTSNCPHTAYTNGIYIAAKASFSNTTLCTLNLNSLGAKKVKVWAGGTENEVGPSQIGSGATYQFRYDAALDAGNGGFLLLNPSPDVRLNVAAGYIKLWPSNTLESGWLWCNGTEVSQTTYSTLYGVVGTTYNTGGETAGYFRVPDIRGRAPFGSDSMGTAGADRINVAGSGLAGNTIGTGGGSQIVTLSLSQVPAHTHAATTTDNGGHTPAGTNSSSALSGGVTGPIKIFPTGQGGGTTNVLSPDTGAATTTYSVTGTALAQTFTGTAVADHHHTLTTDSKGGDGSHLNLPPLLILNYVIKT